MGIVFSPESDFDQFGNYVGVLTNFESAKFGIFGDPGVSLLNA